MNDICLITGAHLCRNPRVVKEAEALASAGFRVTVLGPAFSEELAEQDADLCCRADWRHEVAVDLRPERTGGLRRLSLRLATRMAAEAVRTLGIESPRALGYGLKGLFAAARRQRADLYIAHQEAGLWVGCELLKAGRPVGADFEDWYSRDLSPGAQSRRPLALLRRCEQYLLNRGAFTLTTSEALASALAENYRCPRPRVVYNAFPFGDRAGLDGRLVDREDRLRLSLHWVSQTIGPGRGLEMLCLALRLVRRAVDVHLRGGFTPETEAWLRGQFPGDCGHRLFLHGLVPPAELLSRIAEHDIGLALERHRPDSRYLTVTNKILHYLLAGLAVVATDTAGQLEVAFRSAGAVQTFADGDWEGLAARLNLLVDNPQLLQGAKEAAVASARQRFCWEEQRPTLLEAVREITASGGGGVL